MQRGEGGVSTLFCEGKQQNNSHAGAKNAQLTLLPQQGEPLAISLQGF